MGLAVSGSCPHLPHHEPLIPSPTAADTWSLGSGQQALNEAWWDDMTPTVGTVGGCPQEVTLEGEGAWQCCGVAQQA